VDNLNRPRRAHRDPGGVRVSSGVREGLDYRVACSCYVGRGVPLARGGRRYRSCKRPPTTQRARTEVTLNSEYERVYWLCSQHAAQWDKAERGEGYMPRLTSDER
jgi:hypothetical protein